MLPERIGRFSFKRHWHILIILLCTSLAVASETSNFILGNNSFFIAISPDNIGPNGEEENTPLVDKFEFIWQQYSEAQAICTKGNFNCFRIDYYGRYLLLTLLFFCAWKYWKADNRDRELLDVYQEIFLKNSNPDSAIDSILKILAEKYVKFKGNDRVSIYKYNGNLHCFFRIGRFSRNPDLSSGGEKEYSREKGIIHKTWTCGDYSIESIPKFATTKEWKDFLDKNEIGGFRLNELEKKRMKSRSFYSFLIRDPDAQQNCAIILFESESQKGFSQKALGKLLKSDHGQILKILTVRREISAAPELEPQ